MRLVHLAAGAAGMYCGACNNDVALVRELIARGHDVQMLPLYTPLRVDGPDPSTPRVFMGGINAWLQQHVALFRHTPAFMDRWLNSRRLLGWLGRRAASVEAGRLGPMTVSVLEGAHGRQSKELTRLIRHLRRDPAPDAFTITNTLLSGLAPALRDAFDAPIVCTLQGEETFVSQLGEPYAGQALELIRRNAQAVDRFVAPSGSYAEAMCAWLDVPRERMAVVPPALDLRPFAGDWVRQKKPFRVACLSRITPDKGWDVLVDAFALANRERPGKVKLAVAGSWLKGSDAFWARQQARAKAAGCDTWLQFAGSPGQAGKVQFLRRASVFATATRIEERRAIACLEAMAAGLPVIVPRRGCLPEWVERTGGGTVVAPDEPDALASAILELFDDPDRADRLGRNARTGVHEHFAASRAAERAEQIYSDVLAD